MGVLSKGFKDHRLKLLVLDLIAEIFGIVLPEISDIDKKDSLKAVF